MDVLNQWFVSLDDLDSVDYKISQVQIDSSNNEKLINEILQENESVDKLNDLLDENLDSLNKLGLTDLVHAKIQQIEDHNAVSNKDSNYDLNNINADHKNKHDSMNGYEDSLHNYDTDNEKVKQNLLVELRKIKIDINDKFSISFFFQDEISQLQKVTETYLNLKSVIVDKDNEDFINELKKSRILLLKKKMSELLTKLIEETNWIDSTDDSINSSLLEDIRNCCLQFNSLQLVNDSVSNYLLEGKDLDNNSQKSSWSMEIICFPIISKFLYHFYGKSVTNKLNQPDLPLDFLLSNCLTNSKFIGRLTKNFSNIYNENVVILLIHTFNKFLKLKFKNDLQNNESFYFNNKNNKTKYFNNLIYHLHKYQVSIFDTYYYKFDIITPIIQDYMEKWLTLEELHVQENMRSKFPKVSTNI